MATRAKKKTSVQSQTPQPDSTAADFVDKKKKEMKKSQYRERFDQLASEIDMNLVNTMVSYGQKLYEASGWGSVMYYNKMSNGGYDINVYPQKLSNRDQSRSGVPVSQEPIAFAKILIATSVLGGKLPDCTVIADDKVYAHAMHFLWKRTWENRGGNGQNTLGTVYQYLFTYGWAAWRVYPRRVQVKRKGIDKIIFDDVYREPLDPKRTWLGTGFNNGDYWSQMEVYYEKDMPKEDFFRMYPQAEENKTLLEYCGVSEEAKNENPEKPRTSVTIGYYENVLANRYVVKCGKLIIYDGELPNDDSFGSVVVVHCFLRNANDPYGVGLYELMRGNTAMYTYINSLNAQQVEAEIYPLLFGSQVQNGTTVYKRGPNVINPKNPGTSIDVVNTKGNIQGGIAYANQQKQDIEDNTGVNNILAGDNGDNTLGSTVILKEAATNRLTPARNSMVDGLGMDALISNSWIRQTYSMDKVFLLDSDEQLAEFTKQNPGYFVESQPIMSDPQKSSVPDQQVTDDMTKGTEQGPMMSQGDSGGVDQAEGNSVSTNSTGYEQPAQKIIGHAVVASQNLRVNFDFTPDGELLDNVPTRTVSSRNLFDEMNRYGHKSDYIEFLIDPNSMLLPSIEIQKQSFMAIFPVVTNQITLIFSLRNTDPDAAASQLMTLEKMLEIQREDIYNFISKQDYDAIMSKQPSQSQLMMANALNQGDQPAEEKDPAEIYKVDYKDAPDPIRRQMEAKAGFRPAMAGGGTPQKPQVPKKPMARRGNMGDGTSPLQPQNAREVPRPQSPLGASFDASVGRAANVPFFPGR